MKATHTPGPWEIKEDVNTPAYDIMSAGHDWVATVHAGQDEDTANALLIAHAPAMLDALEDAANVLALASALGYLKGQQAEDAYRNARAILDAVKGA